MRTMLDIAIDFVYNTEHEGAFDFNEIFDVVEDELRGYWIQNLVNDDLPYVKLRERKIGELYRLLTVDGRFIRNNNGTWSPSNK
ncbi:hypothetical protein MADP07_00401 [Mycoplasma anatis]|uniref:HTH HARE-type domain-containing protein n=1 Tax=Mycoplasmopsis anatis TaxID=171279 RepID=A0A9Q3L7I1_9BACT|nr:hypothetical protein [Mycoplasmopsis anatis]MBW0602678.1 hypothetical protein [Mycoplasmopsis anatis]MBW0604237.1 hypothetical protein [Mycoplasmopsis anatis]